MAEAQGAAGAAVVSRIERPRWAAPPRAGEAALVPTAEGAATATRLVTGAASRVAPNILSIAHRERRVGGALYAPFSRVDWATLLRRTFDVDVKPCVPCRGRMTVRAVVTDAASIARLLGALRPSRPELHPPFRRDRSRP